VRVYSKFHDYYDSVQNSQYDAVGTIWNRTNFQAEKDDVVKIMSLLKVVPERCYEKFKPSDRIILKNDYYVTEKSNLNHSCLACLVCVAGKLYPMIEMTFKFYRGNEWYSESQYHFTFESFASWHNQTSQKNMFYGSLVYPQWFFNIKQDALTTAPWELLNTPLFIIRPSAGDWRSIEYSIEGNPELKHLGFMKVLDPFTIWQNIDMFINNQLVHEMDPGTVPDEYRWKQYGFDNKWSFRTRPFS
jgi:hypothetical protein